MTYGTVQANAIQGSINTFSPNSAVFRNRIINGAMVIDQRNAGASITANDNTYAVDRWVLYASQSSKLTAQQNQGSVTPPAGFRNYLGYTSSSAYTVGASEQFTLTQPIEGYNVADLAWGTADAKTVTLSFWVRSSLTGTFGGALRNGANNRTYPFSYTISAANTWEQKSITVAGDTSGTWLTTNGYGLGVGFNLGAGASVSGTAGAWSSSGFASSTGAVSVVGTNGATFYITGVQLEVGSTATSFDYRPYGTELALCQRYFEKSYNTDVAVGANSNVGRLAPGTSSDNGSNASADWRFAVEKRATPTITTYLTSGTSGSWNYERSGSSSTASALSDNPGTRGSRIYLNVGAANVAVWVYGHATASSEL